MRTVLLVLTVILGSCAEAPTSVLSRTGVDGEVRPLDRLEFAQAPAADSASALPSDPKLIRTGEVRIQVEAVPPAAQRADSIVSAFGGFVAERQLAQDEAGRQRATLLLKIPAARMDSAFGALRSLGTVKSEALAQQDVSKAYMDLETRLVVKEEAARRLRELLATRTGKLSDVLDVEREISRVVTEIEQMKGERRYYDNRIALSTITLIAYESGALGEGPSATIGAAFGQALDVLATSVAWLVYLVTFLAPWLVVAGLVWWLVRVLRSRWRAA